MVAPPEAIEAAARWDRLTRWERAELGRKLRRDGWTYSEIMAVLPVVKGTLAGWCKEIRLTEELIAAIKARVPSQKGVPRDTNWKRRLEIETIRVAAAEEAEGLLHDSLWVAGCVLYWAEGEKSNKRLSVVNTDPKALRLFIDWLRAFHDQNAELVLALHLHHGNDEAAAQSWWRQALELPDAQFHKTFIKPAGTGHRKNHLPHGVCRVMMRRSGNAWHSTMVWIEVLTKELKPAALVE